MPNASPAELLNTTPGSQVPDHAGSRRRTGPARQEAPRSGPFRQEAVGSGDGSHAAGTESHVRDPTPVVGGEAISRRAFLRTPLVAFALGLLVDTAWARAVRGLRLQRLEYPKMIVGRYRIHHNVVGYILAAAGLFRHTAVLVPMGLGMIVGHRLRDRLFWFVERVDPLDDPP